MVPCGRRCNGSCGRHFQQQLARQDVWRIKDAVPRRHGLILEREDSEILLKGLRANSRVSLCWSSSSDSLHIVYSVVGALKDFPNLCHGACMRPFGALAGPRLLQLSPSETIEHAINLALHEMPTGCSSLLRGLRAPASTCEKPRPTSMGPRWNDIKSTASVPARSSLLKATVHKERR